MRIIDLCGEWRHYVSGGRDRRVYESSYPQLFDHYYRFWSSRRPDCRWPTVSEIDERVLLVHERLALLESRFAKQNFQLDDLEIILFVGQGTTNGHSFLDKGDFKVWLPVETYATALFSDVFLAHEILHALHYTQAPSWYFSDLDERHRIGRLLITEGVATYLSEIISGVSEGESLWADVLVGEELNAWMKACSDRYVELCSKLGQQFDVSTVDSGFFCLYDFGDVCRARAGYYVGSRLVRELVEHECVDIPTLLGMSRSELEPIIRLKLDNPAG